MPTLIEFFEYTYRTRLAMGGVIGFIALIIAGVLYLTSAGDPDKLRKAKERFKAVFIGLLILYSAYLILVTINPSLVTIQLFDLSPVVFNPLEMPPETMVPNMLHRIREIAEKINEEIGPGIIDTADEIQSSALECSCIFARSSCMCTGGSDNDDCEAQGCYAGHGSHPCRDWEEIQENQKLIVAWKDELFYYKNKAIVEALDLANEIADVLEERENYYEERIAIETNPETIAYFQEQLAEVEQEIELKEELIEELTTLALLIPLTEDPVMTMAALPNRCVYDEEGSYGLENTCDGMCIGDCHDTFIGCQALPCIGLNPCPLIEIMAQNGFIRLAVSEVRDTAQEILGIINELINLKTIII